MREIITYSYEQNLRESLELAEFLYGLRSAQATIARVNGAAIGAARAFSPPAMLLSPRRSAVRPERSKDRPGAGLYRSLRAAEDRESRARRFFLTGERFDAGRAASIGLVTSSPGPRTWTERSMPSSTASYHQDPKRCLL